LALLGMWAGAGVVDRLLDSHPPGAATAPQTLMPLRAT
jgi:hypothetical protein